MFFRIIRRMSSWLVHLLFSFDVSGTENIPDDGPFLLCSNHISGFDVIVLAIFMKRQPRIIGKKELFDNRFLSWFYKALGAYPVNREAVDLVAYRQTMDILKSGEGVMIFSQGTRTAGFEGAKAGVALFALKSGAPIIPAGINGSFRFRSVIRLRIGERISMEKYKGQKVKADLVNEVMEIVSQQVTQLAESVY